MESVATAAGKKNLYFRDVPEEVREQLWWEFISALEPLKVAGKLGAVILQFPPWFQPTRESQDHILWLRERLADTSQEVRLLMNTNRQSQGPANANQLRMLLQEAGVG